MKNLNRDLLLLFFLFITSCKATQFVSKQVVETPRQKFNFKLNDRQDVVEVFPFYISIYPETNIDYKTFLVSLSDEDRIKALPDKDFLRTYNLNEKQLVFLSTKYYSSTEYNNYPIIGLTKSQIQNYLQWKTDSKGKEILTDNDIKFDAEKLYIDLVRELKIKPKYLQVEFNVLLEAQAMSAKIFIESSYSTTVYSNNKFSTNSILETLGIQEVEHYKLERSGKFGELIYNQTDTIKYYESLHHIDNTSFETNNESNILTPLRTWHVKI